MDDGGGCLVALVFAAAIIFAVYSMGKIDGRAEGYRRGYCEGRGGVEATVGDSIRCIQPPETVRTDSTPNAED